MNRCVKIEKLAECVNDKLTAGIKWTEYYSPFYCHPYNADSETFARECDGDTELAAITVHVTDGDWLNDDLRYVGDRMSNGGSRWSENVDAFCDAVDECLKSGGTMYRTIGTESTFCTFRFTALERVPDLVPFATPSNTEGICDINREVPERVYAIFRNAIRMANAETPLPVPMREYTVRYRRSDEGTVKIMAESAEDAIAKAKSLGESDGVWLQSDPDRQADDWEFDIYD